MRLLSSPLKVFGIVVLTTIFFSACTSTPSTPEVETMPEQPNSQNQQMAPTPDTSMEDADTTTAEFVFDVDLADFSFAPNMLTVPAGSTVVVNLSNTGEMPHDLVIDELQVQSDLVAAGETSTLTFTVPESAANTDFEFYCSVGNHRAQGMVGTLVVSEM